MPTWRPTEQPSLRAALLYGLVYVASCGSGPSDSTQSDAKFIPVQRCINCNTGGEETEEETPTREPRAAVSVSPIGLSFYGDMDSERAPEAQSITISNTTPSTVLIGDVYLADHHSKSGRGGAAYFQVGWVPDAEANVLPPNQTLELEIHFSQSTQQRSAVVVIETTHPDYPMLYVGLTGKYFVGDSGW